MRVLVSGTRNGSAAIENEVWGRLDELAASDSHLFLILGDANGVDQYAKNWAEIRKVDHCVKYAKWDLHGKSAGILRNLKMFKENPDSVVAFPSAKSKGTRHVIHHATKKGIPCEVYEV